ELDRTRALGLVDACDLFVRPTRADGDALSVREALALGRPVVASDVGQRPPGALTFPAGDARAAAETIFRALGNPRTPHRPQATQNDDCFPTLLTIYRRCGLATTGTALASSG